MQRLGRYVVLKHLASGGMADVLLGRAESIEGFERHVVLKRIKPEHAKDQRFIRMFLDEARVAANLHHQHVVQVHDIGEAGGEYFIAMEYLHGEDVRTMLSNASKIRQHVPLGCAMAIVSAAAAGLHYAHERRGPDKRPLGIVHRDISPSNILVGFDGSIKVVDFGIAKATARQQETRANSLKGKISYMSPEQCKGGDVDRRSDVYSLGVVLYELCTTTRLFKGESDYLVMDQIVNGRVTLPQVRRPELPNELSAIIMRAISPDPERRYFTADELRLALDHFAAKAALTTSTSAIAAYMRKQFGDKPEPWLEIEGKEFDERGAAGGSAPSKSWTELPGSDLRRSTSSIPRPSGPVSAVPASAGPESAARPRPARLPSTPPPTESKMGWESQPPPAAAPRGFTPAKIAMIVAPLVVVLGIAVWRFAGTGSSSSPVASASAPPPAPAAGAAPVVTPIPEPPRAAAAVATGSAETAPAAVAPAAAPPAPAPVAPAEVAAAAPSEPVTSKRSSSGSSKRSSGTKADAAPAQQVATAKPETAPAAAPAASTAVAASPPPTTPPGPTVAPAPSPPPTTPAPPPPMPVAAIATAVPAAASAPPPPSAPPQTVAATVLDANRIAGDKNVVPDPTTQNEIRRAGVDTIAGTFKICLTPDGAINTVSPLKSTGFVAYDATILSTIRKSWRYKPFLVSGKPAPVCTAVRFVYSQR